MTLLGKILLFANLALSLLMAAWGIALYTGRINWTEQPAGGAERGELKKLTERVTELKPVVAAADARFRDANSELAKTQQRRDAFLKWYEAEAERTKNAANDQNPALAPVLAGGLPIAIKDPQPNAPPLQVEPAKDRAGEPLRAYASYTRDLEAVHTQIKAEMDNLADQNKKYDDLSRQIVGVIQGVGPNAKVVQPGLRQLLQDEEDKLATVFAQQEELRPLLVNSYFDIQLLTKRHELLKKQVQAQTGGE